MNEIYTRQGLGIPYFISFLFFAILSILLYLDMLNLVNVLLVCINWSYALLFISFYVSHIPRGSNFVRTGDLL